MSDKNEHLTHKSKKKKVFGDKNLETLAKEGEAGCVCWRFY